MEKARASLHKGKGSAKHNNHDGYEKKDVSKTFFATPDGQDPNGRYDNLKEFEKAIYKSWFSDMLEKQNDKHRSAGNHSRVKTVEQFYKTKRYSPNEEILQYGHVPKDDEDPVKIPTPDQHSAMVRAYCEKLRKWSDENGQHLRLLDISDHFDEASPHSHLRYVWVYKDKQGTLCIGQEKALEAAGVPLPDPSKPEGRYNNRNMYFTGLQRDMWYDTCEEYGFPVERTPLPTVKGKSVMQYIADRERNYVKRVKELDDQRDRDEQWYREKQDEIAEKEEFYANYESDKAKLDQRESDLNDREDRLDERTAELDMRETRLNDLRMRLDDREAKLFNDEENFKQRVRMEVEKIRDRDKRAGEVLRRNVSSRPLAKEPSSYHTL